MAKYDQDSNPYWFCFLAPVLHWGKKLDPDPHWYQYGFTTLDLSCFFIPQGLHTWNTRWPTGPTSTCRPPGASLRIRAYSTESSTLSNTGQHCCLWAHLPVMWNRNRSATFCLGKIGTGTVMHSGSGSGTGSNIKCKTKVKIKNYRPTF